MQQCENKLAHSSRLEGENESIAALDALDMLDMIMMERDGATD